MPGNLEMTERQMLEGSYSQENPQNGENYPNTGEKLMENQKKTMAKAILNQTNTNNNCNEGELKMDDKLINGADSESNVFSGVDLNANQNPQRAKSTKEEVTIMNNEMKTMAKETLNPNNAKDQSKKGRATMNNKPFNGVESKIKKNKKKWVKHNNICASVILTSQQYYNIKPIFDATHATQEYIMRVLLQYAHEATDCNIRFMIRNPKNITTKEFEPDKWHNVIRYKSSGYFCLSYSNKQPRIAFDFTNANNERLFNYVARKMYGGLS
jgi:hypothetical protein